MQSNPYNKVLIIAEWSGAFGKYGSLLSGTQGFSEKFIDQYNFFLKNLHAIINILL
jgi:hypothetical protein